MIGYHYTTREAWEKIQREGMHTSRIVQHEYDKFLASVPLLPRDAIWVWRGKLNAEQAFITLLQLAEMHGSYDLVLLKVHYEGWGSASLACKEPGDGLIRLSCSFAVGRLDTGSLPIDLITHDVPATAVECIWEINLLDALEHSNELFANA